MIHYVYIGDGSHTGHWSYGSLVLRVTGPMFRPLVLRAIGPTGHWSYASLVLRTIGPTACDRTLILSGKSAFEITLILPGYLVIGVYISYISSGFGKMPIT